MVAVPVMPALGRQAQVYLGFYGWPASLPESIAPDSMRDPTSKNQVESIEKDIPILTSGVHTHAHTHTLEIQSKMGAMHWWCQDPHRGPSCLGEIMVQRGPGVRVRVLQIAG